MGWWRLKRTRGRHAILPGNGHLANAALDRAAEDLKETIMRRPYNDRLVALVRREFGERR